MPNRIELIEVDKIQYKQKRKDCAFSFLSIFVVLHLYM